MGLPGSWKKIPGLGGAASKIAEPQKHQYESYKKKKGRKRTESIKTQQSGDFVTGTQLKIERIREINTLVNEQIKNIDPNAQYQMGGRVVSGNEVIKVLMAQKIQATKEATRQRPGVYVKKGGQYYRVIPKMKYLYQHSSAEQKERIIGSLGVESASPHGKSELGKSLEQSYSTLTEKEKQEYGYRHTNWLDIEPSKIMFYPGGKQYLSEHKDEVVDRFLKGKTPKDVMTDDDLVLFLQRYASEGGQYKKDIDDPEFLRNVAWDIVSKSDEQRRREYFQTLPKLAKWYSSGHHAFISTATFPISLTQISKKYISGKGALTEPFKRIESGKTFLPDLNKFLHGVRPGGPSGLISTTIGSGVSHLMKKQDGGFKRFMSDPVSGMFATGGELLGMLAIGKTFHVGKVGTVRGLGKFRSGVLQHTGVNLPGYTQIMYHMPHRMIRRIWVKTGAKNIDRLIGKPYHSLKTLTHKGLSFAPGKNISEKIKWTIDQAIHSKKLGFSDDFLLGSSGSQRIGRKFIIKSKELHELPSLSTTPYGYVPTRFYRFTPSGLSYSSHTSLLPTIKAPSAFAIRLKNIYKPPAGFKSYDDIIKAVGTQPKGSWGMVGPKMYLGGSEIEINIFGKTVLKRFLPDKSSLIQRFKGYKYYTDVPLEKSLSEVVPVVFTTPVHGGFPTGLKNIGGSLGKIFTPKKSISTSPSSSIINLYSMGYSLSKINLSSNYKSSGSLLSSLGSLSSVFSKSSTPFSYQKLVGSSRGLSSSESIGSSYSVGSSITQKLSIPSYSSYPSKPSNYSFNQFKIKIPYIIYDQDKTMKIKKKDVISGDGEFKHFERLWKVMKTEDLLKI